MDLALLRPMDLTLLRPMDLTLLRSTTIPTPHPLFLPFAPTPLRRGHSPSHPRPCRISFPPVTTAVSLSISSISAFSPSISSISPSHPHPCGISFPRDTAFSLSISSTSDSPFDFDSPPDVSDRPFDFGSPPDVSGPKALGALPPPARLLTSIALVAAATTVGYRVAHLGVATLLGLAGAAVVYTINSSAPEVAAVSLHNLVAGYDDPRELSKEDVDAVLTKHGVSKQDDAVRTKLMDLYRRFVSSILPPGGEDLKGNEVEAIVKFKEALGIDDPDAASVHMQVGRHIFSEISETSDREAVMEQRRAFRKHIYVSTLVFGEASTFLLPWKRIFKLTDAQVDIAVRDNAKSLYNLKLKSISRDVEEKQLVYLRDAQVLYKLSDKIAADMFREHTRKLVEENISAALDILKSRTKATGKVVDELEKVLLFNDMLTGLRNHSEAGRFAPGVGPVSLLGEEYNSVRKMDDLKLLYKTYVMEAFSNGRFEEKKLGALNNLKNIFGLGNREAEDIMLDTTSKLYHRRLSQAYSSGDLEKARIKAAFLQNLCDELHFNPEKASAIHEEIYRQKLQQLVADGELDSEDVAALGRIRVLLCIPQEIVDAAHTDICGKLFEKVVKDAIASGIEGYDAEVRASVRKAAQGLQLGKDAAVAIASKAVRKMFLIYIQRSRGVGDRIQSAKELKKMIAFNTLVVTALISDIKGEYVAESVEHVTSETKRIEEEDEWESLQTLRKTRPNKELQEKLVKSGQTEITLKDDLSQRDRAVLYRTYLMFCRSGEATIVPFGLQITTKKDNTEYLLLSQLGGILGLNAKEIVEIHRSLAEQAFMKRAEVILADGQLTKARVEQLDEAQKQEGLPTEYAQKVIKNIIMPKMAAVIETDVSQGRLGIKQVRELKEAGVDLDSMTSIVLRENLFKKIIKEIFSSGTGVFEAEEVYTKIPADLNIDVEKATKVVKELAKSSLSNSLVQAVALLRQRNREGVVSSLNDMLACDLAVPADQPLSWSLPEELSDLYCIYLKNNPAPEKLSRLQHLLGISDLTAAMLRDRSGKEDEEEKFVF